MFERSLSPEEKYTIGKDILAVLLLSALVFIVNRGIRISGLYMDDLYMWSEYGEQRFLEYVFPLDSTRFRPVYWFIAWIQLGIIKNHIGLIVPFNLLFASLLTAFFYQLAKEMAKSRFCAFVLGILFALSRFSYYNIAQLLGLMEALSMLFVMLMFYHLEQFGKEKGLRNYYIALVFYFLVCFTHERFMVLLPLFFFAAFFWGIRRPMHYAIPLFLFGFIQMIRRITIGRLIPAGTGGTNLSDTFTFSDFFKNLGAGILYLFGVNAGPEHLNGLPWQETSIWIKLSIVIAFAILLSALGKYIPRMVKRGKAGSDLKTDMYRALLMLGFLGGSLLSSSVTIRVEMRWIYVPYLMLLLLVAHVYGIIRDKPVKEAKENIFTAAAGISAYMVPALLLLWGILSFGTEIYLRGGYERIYLFPNQKQYNSLADQTYGRYRESIFGRDLYIVGNEFKVSDFNARTFFKVFRSQKDQPDVNVIFVDSVKEIPQVTSNMVVLKEEVEFHEYSDITSVTRDLKTEIVRGYYRDGWMDESAELNIMAGSNGIIELVFMFPGELCGGEQVELVVNGEREYILEMTENTLYQEFVFRPYEIVNFSFFSNFHMPDAQEKRGEDRLSLLVKIASR